MCVKVQGTERNNTALSGLRTFLEPTTARVCSRHCGPTFPTLVPRGNFHSRLLNAEKAGPKARQM